jgi:hypothetical protein
MTSRFQQLLEQVELELSQPVTDDTVFFIVNEEISLEIPVVEHSDGAVILAPDDFVYNFLSEESLFEEVSEDLSEAKYQGREVKLGKPMSGDVKKYKVYVKDPQTGNIKKVNFGDKKLSIKRDQPNRRKNFRARHRCATAKDRTSARYWSCRMWSSKPVSKILKGK